MAGDEKEGFRNRIIWILGFGGIGAALFFVLLFLLSAISGVSPAIIVRSGLLSKFCIFISAMLSGALCAKRAKEKRLLFALAGEWALLLTSVLCAVLFRKGIFQVSLGVNLVLIVFGAFAGTIVFCSGRSRRRRRG